MDQRLRSDVHFTYALKPKLRLMMRISLPATAICRLFADMQNQRYPDAFATVSTPASITWYAVSVRVNKTVRLMRLILDGD
ncbi:hypothetical protein KIN20_029112 [Parelaphostrongylus tenuis]|uniref:Uncharacterized protein n=1 Tax=Parelaphostrongylus tenuis TaxID=148309 RepID=A0AAD5R204_PARTN|nr:hypothetical protein KIN20_029112 [Parelaphostrongylus tenuis]